MRDFNKHQNPDVSLALTEDESVIKGFLELPFFIRTSLNERVLIVSGGCELIPISKLPRLFPIEYQSIKNQIYQKRFPLDIIPFAGKNCVRTSDCIRLICLKGFGALSSRSNKGPGRKTNRERAASQKGI